MQPLQLCYKQNHTDIQMLYRFIGTGGGRGDDVYVTDSVSMPPESRNHAVEKLLFLQVKTVLLAYHAWRMCALEKPFVLRE